MAISGARFRAARASPVVDGSAPAAIVSRDTETVNARRPTIPGDGVVSGATGREPCAKRRRTWKFEMRSRNANPEFQILTIKCRNPYSENGSRNFEYENRNFISNSVIRTQDPLSGYWLRGALEARFLAVRASCAISGSVWKWTPTRCPWARQESQQISQFRRSSKRLLENRLWEAVEARFRSAEADRPFWA